jgi:phosphoenolpyruvate carboxykinase (ATP)
MNEKRKSKVQTGQIHKHFFKVNTNIGFKRTAHGLEAKVFVFVGQVRAMNDVFSSLQMLQQKTFAETTESLLRNAALLRTKTGSTYLHSNVNHRLAANTRIVFHPEPKDEEELKNAVLTAEKLDLVRLDRNIGKHAFTASLLVPKKYGSLAGFWGSTQFESNSQPPDFITLCLPDWPTQRITVYADLGMTLILGSDYVGECKMSFLRLAMHHAKKKGGLGLHAGSKQVFLNSGKKGVLFFGLSGTGKTTLSTHNLFLKEPEHGVVRQDDIVLLQKDGRAIGTEENFYVKTEGLTSENQPELYKACTRSNALLENVAIKNGIPDFLDTKQTSNGRAIIQRTDLADTDGDVDLDKVDVMFFITRRRDVVPAVAKLSPEQAAAFFMLGESVETSAGDPSQAGKTKRVVGFNPFIVGEPADEGNRFLELVRNSGAQCFLLNTGKIGERQNIVPDVSARIVEQILRDNVTWQDDENWGYRVAKDVPGLDMSTYQPATYYDENTFKEKINALKAERREWLQRFSGLNKKIASSICLDTF